MFLCKFPSTMLKCWAQFWSKFQTLKNQFEQWSGRFVVPEPALKMGPQNQEKKTQETPKNVNNTKPNASFCRTEPFSDKKKIKNVHFYGIGLLAFLWPKTCNAVMTTAKKTLQNKGFVFCCIFCWSLLPQQQHNSKTT